MTYIHNNNGWTINRRELNMYTSDAEDKRELSFIRSKNVKELSFKIVIWDSLKRKVASCLNSPLLNAVVWKHGHLKRFFSNWQRSGGVHVSICFVVFTKWEERKKEWLYHLKVYGKLCTVMVRQGKNQREK